jgi:hypothetical protein
MSLLLQLPSEVLSLVFESVLVTDLFALESVHSELRSFLLSDQTPSTNVWRSAVHALWSNELKLGTHGSWRDAARHLERLTWPILKQSGMKPAVRSLQFYQMMDPMPKDVPSPWATPLTLNIVRATLKHRGDIDGRRQIAMFACSSDFAAAPTIVEAKTEKEGTSLVGIETSGMKSHSSSMLNNGHYALNQSRNDGLVINEALLPQVDEESGSEEVVDEDEGRQNIRTVLSLFNVIKKAKNPEEALRSLLLEFPFLPIDAGEGADRVIYALANLYLETHPDELLAIRNDRNRNGHTNHDNAESAVYILLYSIIMLNTDRHHPSIKSKMTCNEFVRSTQSTVVGEAFPKHVLVEIFNSISRDPLKICAPHVQRKLKNLLDASTRQSSSSSSSSSISIRTASQPTSSIASIVSEGISSRKWILLPFAAATVCFGLLF